MVDRKTKKELKKIDKEIEELEKLYEELYISPCQNDRELREKEQALTELKTKTHELEKKRDRLAYAWWEKA